MDYTASEQLGQDTVLIGVKHFDLAQTLDCGQAFRWGTSGDGFTGIAHGRRLELMFSDGKLIFKNVKLKEFETVWKAYFDFDRNYSELRKQFTSAGGEKLVEAMEFSPGLRLMRQDVWETLISFILSQNSNIPRIKKMINTLCEAFGTPLPCGGYTFPAPEVLANLNAEALAPVRCGYRAEYIIDAARRTADGRFNPATLEDMATDEVKHALLTIHGVGSKVADCVLLYGFGRVEVYPIDVWIKRVMAALYPAGFPEGLRDSAGIAQQFLFHYARMNKEKFI